VPKTLVVHFSRPVAPNFIMQDHFDVQVVVRSPTGVVVDRLPVRTFPFTSEPWDERRFPDFAGVVRLGIEPDLLDEHRGMRLEVTIDPSQWLILLNSDDDDEAFRALFRVQFYIGTDSPDEDPPYVFDVETLYDPQFDPPMADRGGIHNFDALVAPHAPMRISFSKPMATVASHTMPDDAAAWNPRVDALETSDPGGPFNAIRSRTPAGFVPGHDYCITLVPPIGELFPMGFGSEATTGEPLVPPYATELERQAARGSGETTDICFRTGEVRINAPVLNRAAPFASGTLSLDIIDRVHERAACDRRTSYRVWMRVSDNTLRDGLDFEGEPFVVDASTVSFSDQFLEQGEMRGENAILVQAGQLAVPIPQALQDQCSAINPERCPVDIRIDTGSRCAGPEVCQLGDVTSVLADFVPPPDVLSGTLRIDTSDTWDGIIDRICVDLDREPQPSEFMSVHVTYSSFTPGEATFNFLPGDPRVELSQLGDGRVRWCVGPVDLGFSSGTIIREVTVSMRDFSGNVGTSATMEVECQAPPRKFVGFDGRRSAFALDREGVPHVLVATNNSISLFRWVESQDAWLPMSGGNINLPAGRQLGWTVDLAFNSHDEPVICYTHAEPPAGAPVAWEVGTPALVEVRVARALVPVTTTISTQGRNMGCAIAARRNRTSSERDYLAVFTEVGLGGANAIGMRYLTDSAPGTDWRATPFRTLEVTNTLLTSVVQLALSQREPEAVRGGVRADIAVDGQDAFWITTQSIEGVRISAFGEHVLGEGQSPAFRFLADPHEATRWVPVTGSRLGLRPRIAARGRGELGIVYTHSGDGTLAPKLNYIRRPDSHVGNVHPNALPLAMQIPGLEASEELTLNLRNNGNIASLDGLFAGIPADVAFIPGEFLPVIAWAAGKPGGKDYNALLVARPSATLAGTYDVETIDGRVELSANVHLAPSGAGRVRIAYHNGLGTRGVDHFNPSPAGFSVDEHTMRGSISFYREEDEDELFTRRPRRGSARCFADSLIVQDKPGPRGADAGLDNYAVSMVPRPAINPDPCGRTTDIGLTDEVTYALLRAIMQERGAETERPPRRYPSRYRRLAGESAAQYAERTNAHRRDMLLLLRDLLVDLSFLDDIFPRADERSWNAYGSDDADLVLDNVDEELFTDPRLLDAGALDAIFLAIDELADDVCGMRTNFHLCTAGDTTIPVDGDRVSGLPGNILCTTPGVFERNPNGYYPGQYYRKEASLPPGMELDPFGETSLNEYTTHFGPDVWSIDGFKNDAVAPGARPPGDSPGLLGLAVRGLGIGRQGLFREGSHVCKPADRTECAGAGARAADAFR
jgi:hypothetical protein